MTVVASEFTLGDRMKRYEQPWRHELPPDAWCVLRVDVRTAHTYLHNAFKPFDQSFTDGMTEVAEALCSEIQGARLAYSQSDEVSVIYRRRDVKSETWFGGVVAKQVSISAALATAILNSRDQRPSPWLALFDSRVFTLPDEIEVANYLIWRQRDAQRNAISMVARSVFSHQQLYRKSGPEMLTMLQERGLNYEQDVAAEHRMGRQTLRQSGVRPFSYVDRRSNETVTGEALRAWWETAAAPFYTVTQILEALP